MPKMQPIGFVEYHAESKTKGPIVMTWFILLINRNVPIDQTITNPVRANASMGIISSSKTIINISIQLARDI